MTPPLREVPSVMAGDRLQPLNWNRRRWIYTVAALFLLQLGLVLYLAERGTTQRPAASFRTDVYLAANPWSANRLAELPVLTDPMAFALPNLEGFSGEAWMTFKPVAHRLPDWSEPPRWLEVNGEILGKDFLNFISTNGMGPLLTADKPISRLINPGFIVPDRPLRTRSELRIEGELAERLSAEAPTLPSWMHPDLLSDTVVRVLVDSQGRTRTAALLNESGLSEADQLALTVARDLRFEPAAEGKRSEPQLTSAKLIFQWHTAEPAAVTSPAEG